MVNTEENSFSEDLLRYGLLLWRWAWLMALSAGLAAGAAFLTCQHITPVYQATTLVLVSEAPNKAIDYTAVMTSERLARTYAQLMTTGPVLEGVVRRLDLAILPEDLAEAVQVQPVRDTQLIQVSAEDSDPARAAAIANTIVAEFSEQNQAEQASRHAASRASLEVQLEDLDRQIEAANAGLDSLGSEAETERARLEATVAQHRQTYAALLVSYEQERLAEGQITSPVAQKEPAKPPREPVRPRTLANTALAGAAGLALAVGAIFLKDALDDTLKDPEQVTNVLGLPVLGAIANSDPEGGGLVTAVQPRAPASEAFRTLRTNLQFASPDRPLRTLLVTSPTPGDGKTTISANLGVIIAQGGSRVILVDADLRRPQLHRLIGLPDQEGVTSLILQARIVSGDFSLNGQVQETGVANLRAITAGDLPPNPAELLGSETMGEVLRQLQAEADIVILDSPPVLAVTDAAVLAPRLDGVLLVLRPSQTKMAACRQAVEQLRRVGANLLGVVLNDVPTGRSGYAAYRYNGYYYSYPDEYGYSGEERRAKNRVLGRSKRNDTRLN